MVGYRVAVQTASVILVIAPLNTPASTIGELTRSSAQIERDEDRDFRALYEFKPVIS